MQLTCSRQRNTTERMNFCSEFEEKEDKDMREKNHEKLYPCLLHQGHKQNCHCLKLCFTIDYPPPLHTPGLQLLQLQEHLQLNSELDAKDVPCFNCLLQTCSTTFRFSPLETLYGQCPSLIKAIRDFGNLILRQQVQGLG